MPRHKYNAKETSIAAQIIFIFRKPLSIISISSLSIIPLVLLAYATSWSAYGQAGAENITSTTNRRKIRFISSPFILSQKHLACGSKPFSAL